MLRACFNLLKYQYAHRYVVIILLETKMKHIVGMITLII